MSTQHSQQDMFGGRRRRRSRARRSTSAWYGVPPAFRARRQAAKLWIAIESGLRPVAPSRLPKHTPLDTEPAWAAERSASGIARPTGLYTDPQYPLPRTALHGILRYPLLPRRG